MKPAQFQHCLASISDKEISADGWSRCVDNVSMPPELLKSFDYSLLEPQDKIPDGNASRVACVNYVVRTLQMMIGESDVFKHQLMWDSKYNSWRLVFAFLSGASFSHILKCDVEAESAGCVATDEQSKVARLVQGSEDA